MPEPQAFVAGGTPTQPQRFVGGDGETLDEAQQTGAWLATDSPVEVER